VSSIGIILIVALPVVLAGLISGMTVWLFVRLWMRQGTAAVKSYGFTYKFWDNSYLKQWLAVTQFGQVRNAASTDIVKGILDVAPFVGFLVRFTSTDVIWPIQVIVARISVRQRYPRTCADFTGTVSQVSGGDAAFSDRLRVAIDSVLAASKASGAASAMPSQAVASGASAGASVSGQFCADGETLWMGMIQPNRYANRLFHRMDGFAEAVDVMIWEARLLMEIDSRMG